MTIKDRYLAYHKGTVASLSELNDFAFVDCYTKSVEICVNALKGGHKIFTAGNGGSHADAIHIAGELVNYFTIPHKGFPVMALGCNPSVLTSWANDHCFEEQMSRELSAYAESGDVLIAITTSGKSKNIHKLIDTARKHGVKVLALTSTKGAEIIDADIALAVPSDRTPHIQEGHIIVYHALCAEIEFQLTQKN
jgi:D-sedoheptulose 7-phosphate isomerase